MFAKTGLAWSQITCVSCFPISLEERRVVCSRRNHRGWELVYVCDDQSSLRDAIQKCEDACMHSEIPLDYVVYGREGIPWRGCY